MGLEYTIETSLIPEARIISENATHAAVTILISKAWLTRNMPFLAALADCATVPSIETIAPIT